VGGTFGFAAAFAVSHLLRGLLFHVGPHDPISYGFVVLLLSLVALGATLIPARSAMKTDPMKALRCE
jgi:putative ABC transport system permease protein